MTPARRDDATRRQVLQLVTQLEPAGAQSLAWWIEKACGPRFNVVTRFLYRKAASDLFDDEFCLAMSRPTTLASIRGVVAGLVREMRSSAVVVAHTHYAIAAVLLLRLVAPRCRVIAVHHWPVAKYPRFARGVLFAARTLRIKFDEVFVSAAIATNLDSVVIPNPVPNLVDYLDTEVHAKADQQYPPLPIVAVARHSREKRLDTLVSAMPLLAGHHLVVAGQGPETASLARQAQSLGVANRVTFVGALSRKEVFELMRAALVVVLPSQWEAMPMVLLEAIANECPIVVSDIPEHEFLISSGAALGFEVGDPQGLALKIGEIGEEATLANLKAGRALVKSRQSDEAVARMWIGTIEGAMQESAN